MKNFPGLIEFRYLRDMSILYAVRETKKSVQQIIQLRIKDSLDFKLDQHEDIWTEYLKVRNRLFPNSDWLFPTEDGALFLPSKFKQNTVRMLGRAKQLTIPSHPLKLSLDQLQALEGLRFECQRPRFQIALAVAILGLMALRPEEVAKLRRSDVSIEDKTLFLRDTKSQENQIIPIHPGVLSPLENYIRHIPHHNDPLFIRHSKNAWDRKDVYRATRFFSGLSGIEQNNPRRMRKTVANILYKVSKSLPVAKRALRHEQEETTLAFYIDEASQDDLRDVMNLYPDLEA